MIKINKYIHSKLSYLRTLKINTRIVNFIIQRIFRIHGALPYSVHFTSTIVFGKNIQFHKDKTTLTSFALSGGCYFQANNGIKLGENFLFAPGVKLISSNHDKYDRNKSIKTPPIIIGNNVWVGANAIILPNVKIADNCIIAAGAVVTKSFHEPNIIIAGNPARKIKKIEH